MKDNASVVKMEATPHSKCDAPKNGHEGSIPSAGTGRIVHCKKEPYDVYIGRPGPWGNPFSHQKETQAQFKVDNKEEAIACFREWFLTQPDLVKRAKKELRGKVLGCWCHPKACHGDVLVEVANKVE